MKVRIEADVTPHFQKEECYHCPFSVISGYENYECVLFEYEKCPAEIVIKETDTIKTLRQLDNKILHKIFPTEDSFKHWIAEVEALYERS